MAQSRKHSIEETLVSTGAGLVISTILNHTIVPAVLHTEVSASQNVTLTAVFTLASLLRGYVLRRHYNQKTLNSAK